MQLVIVLARPSVVLGDGRAADVTRSSAIASCVVVRVERVDLDLSDAFGQRHRRGHAEVNDGAAAWLFVVVLLRRRHVANVEREPRDERGLRGIEHHVHGEGLTRRRLRRGRSATRCSEPTRLGCRRAALGRRDRFLAGLRRHA